MDKGLILPNPEIKFDGEFTVCFSFQHNSQAFKSYAGMVSVYVYKL